MATPKLSSFIISAKKLIKTDGTVINSADAFCQWTNSFRSVPPEDSEQFEGNVFKAEIKFTIASGATRYLAFSTPVATKNDPRYILWATDVVKSDVNDVEYRLWEDIAYTVGDIQPIINLNRPLKDIVTTSAVLTPNPTDVDLSGGTQIDLDATLGSQDPGIFGNSSGGQAVGLKFLILSPNTDYAIELINNSTDAANVVVKSRYDEAMIPTLYAIANQS